MAGTQQIQTTSSIYQQKGWVGDCARPEEPTLYDYQHQAGVALKPGQGVWYDRANNNWKLPTNVAAQLDVTGFVSFDPAMVAEKLTSTPTGANSRQNVTIPLNDPVKIGLMGSFWALAGEALEPGDLCWYDHDSANWKRFAISTGGVSFPGSPDAGDLHRLNVGGTISGARDINGSTALTSGVGGDVFRRTGSNWVKRDPTTTY